ncbi:hypothetical protein, partial [Klebsiella aerogenes]
VHDAIPERKRLIGQFHLFNVKTPLRRGFCYLEVGTKMNDCPRRYTRKKAAYRSVSPLQCKNPAPAGFLLSGGWNKDE